MSLERTVLLTGSAYPELAEEVGKWLGQPVYRAYKDSFADNEANIEVPISVRDNKVAIINTTCPPNVDRHYIETAFIADACIRSSAAKVSAIVPHFGYARQERTNDKRRPVSIAVMLQLLQLSGVSHIAGFDIHAEGSIGAVRMGMDIMHASSCTVPAIRDWGLNNLVICSDDQGSVPRAEAIRSRLEEIGVDVADQIAVIVKERDQTRANQSRPLTLSGTELVRGANVVIVADMIDTAGTLSDGGILLDDAGAKSVRAVATHGLFSSSSKRGGPMITAIERIKQSPIERVMVTNTVKQRSDVLTAPIVQIVDISQLLAKGIECMMSGQSLTKNFHNSYLFETDPSL